jgi:nitroimidazol reductase NimA-like FMN-containing flavoprotein (pyridoxamine 5'-phosphate oxidase superfamily)
MTSSTGPHVRELTPAECHELIARNHVARIAFTWHDRVDIEPIGYVNDGDWIYGRTSGGTKLSTLLHHPWCAVEMDEVSGLFDWTSVVVKGTFHLLDPETSSSDAYQRAEGLLRKLVPGTFRANDPTPHRGIVFGVYANEITGRSSRS